jgi:hypothetical protein
MAITRIANVARATTTSLIQSSRTKALSTRKKRREINKTRECRFCGSTFLPWAHGSSELAIRFVLHRAGIVSRGTGNSSLFEVSLKMAMRLFLLCNAIVHSRQAYGLQYSGSLFLPDRADESSEALQLVRSKRLVGRHLPFPTGNDRAQIGIAHFLDIPGG